MISGLPPCLNLACPIFLTQAPQPTPPCSSPKHLALVCAPHASLPSRFSSPHLAPLLPWCHILDIKHRLPTTLKKYSNFSTIIWTNNIRAGQPEVLKLDFHHSSTHCLSSVIRSPSPNTTEVLKDGPNSFHQGLLPQLSPGLGEIHLSEEGRPPPNQDGIPDVDSALIYHQQLHPEALIRTGMPSFMSTIKTYH